MNRPHDRDRAPFLRRPVANPTNRLKNEQRSAEEPHVPTGNTSVQMDSRRAPIILLCHFVPYPPASGIELRVYRLLQWLKDAGYRVVLIISAEFTNDDALKVLRSLTFATHWTKPAYAKKLALRTRLGMRFPFLRRVVWESVKLALTRTRRAPGGNHPTSSSDPENDDRRQAWFMSDELMRFVWKLAHKYKPRAMIVEYVFATPYFAASPPDTLKIVDTIDVFSLKEEQVGVFGIDDFLSCTEEEERRYLLKADVIVAIQPREAALLKAIVPDRDVILAGVDFDVAEDSSGSETVPYRIVVVASDNPLNVHGLQLFLADCWPSIKRSCMSATLHVVGGVGNLCRVPDSSIQYTGWVADLDSVYREASVVINPTIAGTGLKIKSVEALAHGKPLVAWTHGVDGLEYEGEAPFIVCESWEEFGTSVVRLLTSATERNALTERALAYARREFDASSVYADLRKCLGEP